MTPDKRVEEIVKEFEVNHGQYTSHESREDAKVWLRTTLHQDRASLHTSLVAAVEGMRLIVPKKVSPIEPDYRENEGEFVQRTAYNHALDDTLTIINSIFKE